MLSRMSVPICTPISSKKLILDPEKRGRAPRFHFVVNLLPYGLWGEKLRTLLASSRSQSVKSVIHFGDLQIFEGVTTYPAILTVRKG